MITLQIVIGILIAKIIIGITKPVWKCLCPIIYATLRKIRLGNSCSGNLNKYDKCGNFKYTVLPSSLNPFK